MYETLEKIIPVLVMHARSNLCQVGSRLRFHSRFMGHTIIMIPMFLYFSMDTIFNLNKFIGILK